MISKTTIRAIARAFLINRLAAAPGALQYLLDPVRLEPFVFVAYEKLEELTKLGHVPTADHAARYIQDQCERWGNRKLDGLLTTTLQDRLTR